MSGSVDKGIQKLLKDLMKYSHDNNVRITLETMAGKGTEVGDLLKKLLK